MGPKREREGKESKRGTEGPIWDEIEKRRKYEVDILVLRLSRISVVLW